MLKAFFAQNLKRCTRKLIALVKLSSLLVCDCKIFFKKKVHIAISCVPTSSHILCAYILPQERRRKCRKNIFQFEKLQTTQCMLKICDVMHLTMNRFVSVQYTQIIKRHGIGTLVHSRSFVNVHIQTPHLHLYLMRLNLNEIENLVFS